MICSVSVLNVIRFVCLVSEIVCTGKNSQSKLCRQVESMREQLNIIPRLKKKLEEQEKLLSSTSETIITLSKALTEQRESSAKVSSTTTWM